MNVRRYPDLHHLLQLFVQVSASIGISCFSRIDLLI